MIVSKTWFFQNVATRDRFLERNFPNQSDRPSQQTFQNLVDTFAEEVVVQGLAVTVTSLASRITTLEAQIVNKVDTSTFTTALALKEDKSVVTTLTGRVTTAENNIVNLTNNKADITWVQANYPEQTEFNNAINNLQVTKLDTTVFNAYKDNVVNPRLNTEHIIFNPKLNGESLFVPFISNTKVVIKNIEIRGVISWKIYAVNGNVVLFNELLDSSSFSTTSLPKDFKTINPNADGFVIVAETIQGALPQFINPTIILRVDYIY